MIPWLSKQFPDIELALTSPNGLLVAGGDLSVPRLLDAYKKGIFPWFNPGEPILWWSPDPRMVLVPSEFKVSKSLGKLLRNTKYLVLFDHNFEQVMRNCAAPRNKSSGTWISEEIITAYCDLHRSGHAHSVEVYMDNKLVGGVYGVSIGRMFFGESMFSHISNGSKIALAHLAKQLDRWGFGMIDCQMSTAHLSSLGASEMPRSHFITQLKTLVDSPLPLQWNFDRGLFK